LWKGSFSPNAGKGAWSEKQGVSYSICSPRSTYSRPCPVPVFLGLLWFAKTTGPNFQANISGAG